MASFRYEEDNDQPGFWQRHGVALGVVVVLLIGGGLAVGVYFLTGKPSKPKPPEEIAIHLLPPPPQPTPPPPPPPKVPPPPEQKMAEQPPLKPNEAKPKLDLKSPDRPPGPPGPVASGPPSDSGLAVGGEGGDGTGGGGGSRWGWYAGEVQSRIAAALRENDKTKAASLRVKVRIWVNNSGSIVRATLGGSSGDVALDDALKHQILIGLNLPDAPPADMPMPIVMLINEQRPN